MLHTKTSVTTKFLNVQDLSAITPKRYESKTVGTKGVGKVKRKAAMDNNPVTTAPKKTRGYACCYKCNIARAVNMAILLLQGEGSFK